MCGIVGFIATSEITTTDNHFSTVKKMTKALSHRGPDGEGFYFGEKIIFGNRRLSVLDLSENGALPMHSEKNNIWIAYNGEVSNFKELKKKYALDTKYEFKSTTDTEVLIYLYSLLGIDFIKELSGMFAFCLYDNQKNKAYLVRDGHGILPLYYHQNHEGLYFSSEIKALLEIPSINPSINKEAIYHYFSLAYIPDNLTPFNEITEIRGGEMLVFDLSSNIKEEKTFYELEYKEDFSISAEKAIETTRELIIDSIRRNLVSDAPLGMTLSGGIDSSAMLGVVKKLGLASKMHTFSLKMGEASFDESKYQRRMVQYAGSIHHEIEVRPEDVIDNMMTQIAYIDEPNGNGACIPSFILAKEASKTVKVLLSGEGGDELFNAYPTIAAYQYRKLYRKAPSPLRHIIKEFVNFWPSDYRKLSLDFKAKRFTQGAELSVPDAHLYWRHVFTGSEKNQLLNNTSIFNPTETFYRNLFNKESIENEINKISLIDMRHFFIDDLMVKNDRTFLANSVEGRFPFMDKYLVDYVTKLPVEYKVKGFSKLRWVEKEAMKPFLPKEIYQRDGFGLEMPHSIWFLDQLGSFAEKYINKEFVNKTEILNWEFIEKIWNLHISGKKDYGRPIWCVLNFLIWFDLFVLSNNHREFRL